MDLDDMRLCANEQKEKFIEEKLKQKLTQNVKKRLYQEEYVNVYERIKREIKGKITEEFLMKKKKEQARKLHILMAVAAISLGLFVALLADELVRLVDNLYGIVVS